MAFEQAVTSDGVDPGTATRHNHDGRCQPGDLDGRCCAGDQPARPGIAVAQGGRNLPDRQPTHHESAASLKLYAELIDLLDMVVDVDILSGTSAGGINAALLAWSRVTGSDLGGLRDIWLDLGALTELLRDPTDKSTPSLLYGDERMFAALAKQIPKLATGPFPPAAFAAGARPPAPPPSTSRRPCSTERQAGSPTRTARSSRTSTVAVSSPSPRIELAKTLARAPALALAARSSASFPVAFEPSFVPFTERDRRATGRTGSTGDGDLRQHHPPALGRRRWPARQPAHRRAAHAHLRPSRPTAGSPGAAVRRAVFRASARPGEERLHRTTSTTHSGLVDGLLKDLAAVTTQSIAADLRAIRAHQDRMEARTDAKLRLAELAATLPDGISAADRVPADGLRDARGNQTRSSAHQCAATPAQHLAAGAEQVDRKHS